MVTDRRSFSLPLEKVKDAIRAQIYPQKTLKKDVVVQVNKQLLK